MRKIAEVVNDDPRSLSGEICEHEMGKQIISCVDDDDEERDDVGGDLYDRFNSMATFGVW